MVQNVNGSPPIPIIGNISKPETWQSKAFNYLSKQGTRLYNHSCKKASEYGPKIKSYGEKWADYGRMCFSPSTTTNSDNDKNISSTPRTFNPPKILEDCDSLAKDRLQEALKREYRPEKISIVREKIVQDLPLTKKVNLEKKAEWAGEKRVLQNKVSELLGHLNFLSSLANIYGIDANTQKLMGLAKKASITPTKSIRELFIEEYLTPGKNYQSDPKNKVSTSFFKWLRAGFQYLFMHKLGIIQKTTKTYIKSFIAKIEKELTEENGAAKTDVISKFLSSTSEFLENDRKAHKIFANQGGTGNLLKDQNGIIEKSLTKPFDKLVSDFADYVVKNSIDVRFFKKLQAIRGIGWFFDFLNFLVNKIIIQGNVKKTIPPQLHAFRANVIEGNQHNNLPIQLNALKFLREQLETLAARLNEENSTETETEILPGSDRLKNVVQNLLKNILLDSTLPSEELKKKIEELENPGVFQRIFANVISGTLEEAAIEGGHLLLNFLNETLSTGELSVRALELTLAPFDYEEKTSAEIKKEHDQELEQFLNYGGYITHLLIKKGVESTTKATSSENIKEIQEVKTKEFEARHTVSKKVANKIKTLSEKLKSKENIHEELASIFNYIVFLTQDSMIIPPQYRNPNKIPTYEAVVYDKTARDLNIEYEALHPLLKKAKEVQESELNKDDIDSLQKELKNLQTLIQKETIPSKKSIENILKNIQNSPVLLNEKLKPFNEFKQNASNFLSKIQDIKTYLKTLHSLEDNAKQLIQSPSNRRSISHLRSQLYHTSPTNNLPKGDKEKLFNLFNASKNLEAKKEIEELQKKYREELENHEQQLKDLFSNHSDLITTTIQEKEKEKETLKIEKENLINELQLKATDYENVVNNSKAPIPAPISRNEEMIATAVEATVVPYLAGYSARLITEKVILPIAIPMTSFYLSGITGIEIGETAQTVIECAVPALVGVATSYAMLPFVGIRSEAFNNRTIKAILSTPKLSEIPIVNKLPYVDKVPGVSEAASWGLTTYINSKIFKPAITYCGSIMSLANKHFGYSALEGISAAAEKN